MKIYDRTGEEITTKQVSLQDTEELSFIVALLESAFPLCERRETSEFITLIEKNELVECYCIYVGMEKAGFYYLWRFEEFLFWEFIAISPEFRSRAIISTLFTHIRAKEELPFIGEVEPPTTEFAIRRIGLYERLGWEVLSIPYMQPPFRKEENPVPMLLMQHTQCAKKIPDIDVIICLLCYSVYNEHTWET